MNTLILPVTYSEDQHMVVEVDANQAAQLLQMALQQDAKPITSFPAPDKDAPLAIAIDALRHIAGLSGLNSDFDRAEAAKHRALRALERIGVVP
jgi:predicted transcriptional regulator